MIISLAIVPLLLCICFLLVAYSNYSYISLTSLNLCRKHLLTGQDKIRLEMIKLIDINPRAKKMRKDVKKARNNLARSKSPPEFAIRTAQLIYQLGKQQMLSGEQKIHITKAKLFGIKSSTKLISELKKLNNNTKVYVSDFPFSLTSSPAFSPTPDYKKTYNFKDKQKVSANWVMKSYNQKFLNTIINNVSSPDITESCSTTIDDKEGKKWQAILVKKGRL